MADTIIENLDREFGEYEFVKYSYAAKVLKGFLPRIPDHSVSQMELPLSSLANDFGDTFMDQSYF
jgi:hypothetical protein